MSEFSLTKATRQGVIPLIDLYSESGCGKTMSALLLARGLAGASGEIAMIDTESRRGSLYADVIPGGFNVLDLEAPFTPSRYIEALEAVFKSNAKVVVVDSMSHEWEGMGGICDMAADSESKSGRPGLHNWKMPKFEHAKLVQFLLRSPIPIICCIRAKYKTRQKKDDKGKTIIVKDDVTSPIQSEEFIFEATAHAEILPNHSIILTKCSHPELRKCFPPDKETPLTIQNGEALALWCNAAGKPSTATTSQPTGERAELEMKLWKTLAPIRTPKLKGWAEADTFLLSNKIITEGQSGATLGIPELKAAITKAEIVLEEMKQSQT